MIFFDYILKLIYFLIEREALVVPLNDFADSKLFESSIHNTITGDAKG